MGVEGTIAPEVVARARRDLGFRRTIRVAALVASVVLVVVLLVVSLSTRVPLPVGLVLLASFGVLGSTLSRADLVEARVTAAGLELVGQDGLVRSIPGRAIGALGINGTVLSGRLFTSTFGVIPGTNGRLVVLDPEGRVICARRAGWTRVEDVAALAAAGGVPYVGKVASAVPGATLAPPTDLVPPVPGPPLADPATAAGLLAARDRQRTAWTAVGGVLVLGALAVAGLIVLPADAPGRTAVQLLAVAAVLGVIFGGLAVAQAGDHVRQARSVLRRAGGWYLVEAVVSTGLASNSSARVVGVVDPRTAEPELYTVRGGGERGWLQGDDRTWFWFAPAARGKKAVMAPLDRSHVALLEQRLLHRLTHAEARGQIRSERESWDDRRAWQAWEAEQARHAQTAWEAHQAWAEAQWQAQQAATDRRP